MFNKIFCHVTRTCRLGFWKNSELVVSYNTRQLRVVLNRVVVVIGKAESTKPNVCASVFVCDFFLYPAKTEQGFAVATGRRSRRYPRSRFVYAVEISSGDDVPQKVARCEPVRDRPGSLSDRGACAWTRV